MKKVLIIDDDSDVRDVMKTILAGKYEVREAESREEGVAVLKNYLPDLMVLDVMMEEIDSGFGLAKEIKNTDQYKNMKILMVTSIDLDLHMYGALDDGELTWLPVDDYIVKPIKGPQEFLSKVEKLIGREEVLE